VFLTDLFLPWQTLEACADNIVHRTWARGEAVNLYYEGGSVSIRGTLFITPTVVDYNLQFDSDHRVLLITLGAVVTEASAAAAYAAVQRFIAAQGPFSGITDLSAVEKLSVSTDFVRSLAAMDPMIPAGMSRIAVAPRPSVYGISRMFQILREGKGSYLEVVHTLQEAYALLGIKSPHFKAIDSTYQAGGR
jgi:hypothetical protein